MSKQIFTTLAENGRLSRAQLQYHTRIPTRKLRAALVVLIQQHVLRHYTTDDGTGTTFYQVDWRNSYYLTRSNRIITLVEERYGEGAGKIVANLLQLGHARVGDLAHAFDLESASKQQSEHTNGGLETNGTDESHGADRSKITTVAQLHMTLRTLLQHGFLVKFGKRDYMPGADLAAELEEEVILNNFPDRKVTGPKKQREYKIACRNLKRKWTEENAYSDQHDTGSRGTIRHPAKRARLNGRPNGVVHEDDLSGANVPKLPVLCCGLPTQSSVADMI